jgi:hypothetical protein
MGAGSSTENSHNSLDSVKPKRPIRRFDIFAEYNRLKGLDSKDLDEAHAKGYGLWVAKVVASGGGRRAVGEQRETAAEKQPGAQKGHEHAKAPSAQQEWHELGGEPQPDALFDREITGCMGPDRK